jgi:hypothetical protein
MIRIKIPAINATKGCSAMYIAASLIKPVSFHFEKCSLFSKYRFRCRLQLPPATQIQRGRRYERRRDVKG